MRLRSAAVALVVVAGAAVCVRLGFWQLARLHQKQALNAALARSLALPPLDLSGDALRGAQPESLANRRVVLRGSYDEARQALLMGQIHEGEPGVHVLTPLVVAGGTVLVDRGWIPAPDAVSARPREYPAPGAREVVGLAEPYARARGATGTRWLEDDSVHVLATARADVDTIAARLGVPLAPFLVAELPSPTLASPPFREPPPQHEEFMHLSYAVQWFSFATILLVGSSALAWSRRRRDDTSA